MKQLLAVSIVISLTTPVGAVIVDGRDPVRPDPPAAQVESQREQQQQSNGAEYSLGTDPSTNRIQSEPIETYSQAAADFSGNSRPIPADQKAMAGITDEQKQEQQSKKTRGLVMIIASGACMLGMGLGRIVMNTMSRSSAKEAEIAMEEPLLSPDDRSVSHGGDHREYIID